MQARGCARRLERKMKDDNLRRTLRFATYITKANPSQRHSLLARPASIGRDSGVPRERDNKSSQVKSLL